MRSRNRILQGCRKIRDEWLHQLAPLVRGEHYDSQAFRGPQRNRLTAPRPANGDQPGGYVICEEDGNRNTKDYGNASEIRNVYSSLVVFNSREIGLGQVTLDSQSPQRESLILAQGGEAIGDVNLGHVRRFMHSFHISIIFSKAPRSKLGGI